MRSFLLKLSPFLLILTLAPAQQQLSEAQLKAKARKFAKQFILVDGHVDIPYRLRHKWEDISKRTETGDFDYVRAKAGGIDAPFMSIYTPSEYEQKGGAKALADTLIDMVYDLAKSHPSKFAVAKSVADVRAQFRRGLISLPMGMENGSPIEKNLANVEYFADRGIRYITLTHGKDNHISDSSYDTTHTWKGLSPFGRKVVAEMNRTGIMIDISHVSDAAFWEVMNVTAAPAIASHSSCRYFTPGWERNMSDDMIKALAKNGGVIMINFGSSFVTEEYRQAETKMWASLGAKGITWTSPNTAEEARAYTKNNPLPFPNVSDVVNHIDHVVKLVGVDHVGFGSDFDGVGDTLPIGLKDVSHYPNVIEELLKRGYSDGDIEKICSGNLLRVWSEVEHTAKRVQQP
ncbi:MAG: dipeptidase [Bacteroidota bacterium]